MTTLLQELIIESGDDLSHLPKDVISAIKKNIRNGAEDVDQKWGNALELLHKAFAVEGVERPEPGMKSAWKQYEELLSYTVKQLSDNRGINADWRMSSSVFREVGEMATFKVEVDGKTFITEAEDVTDILNEFENQYEYDINVKTEGDVINVKYSKWGIHQMNVKISKIS